MRHYSSFPEALQRIAGWYDRNGFRTRTNDGFNPAFTLDREGRRLEPQLVVWEGQCLVRFVGVETRDSLDEGAVGRWKAATGAGVPLHVYVPLAVYDRAFALWADSGL